MENEKTLNQETDEFTSEEKSKDKSDIDSVRELYMKTKNLYMDIAADSYLDGYAKGLEDGRKITLINIGKGAIFGFGVSIILGKLLK